MLLPTKNIKLFVWGFRGVRQGLQVIGVGTEGYSARNLCLAMCCSMCICGNFFFFFFLELRESPGDATIIPWRGGSKVTGNSTSLITAFFLKAQHSSLTLPAPLPSWLGHAVTLFSRTKVLSHCAIWPLGSQEGLEENWLLQPSGALAGLGNHLSLCPWDYGWILSLAVFLGRMGECPKFCRTTWYFCRADTKSQTLGIVFFFPVLRAPVGDVAISQYNPNLSVDLCNIYCFGLQKNAKLHWEEILFLQVFSGISEGSSEGLEYRKPKTISRRMELEHLVNLATLLPLPLVEKTSSPLPVPFPGFLNYSVLIQRCYLPNTFPTHSCQFCLFNVPDPQLPSQPLFPVFIALKVTLGPQTQELIFWPVG